MYKSRSALRSHILAERRRRQEEEGRVVEEERLKRERENRKKQEQSRWVDCDAKGSLSKTIHLKSASECNFKTLFLYLFLCHGVIGY